MTTLDRLRDLMTRATPGPLVLSCCHEHDFSKERIAVCFGVRGAAGRYVCSDVDNELHVAAVNALPVLVEVADAARAWFPYGENAPGHCRCPIGIWNDDNGPIDDKLCAMCFAWNRFRTALDNLDALDKVRSIRRGMGDEHRSSSDGDEG